MLRTDAAGSPKQHYKVTNAHPRVNAQRSRAATPKPLPPRGLAGWLNGLAGALKIGDLQT
jgi:hypothetical protein